MNNVLVKREFVSFDGACPLRCKHCYTYQLETAKKARTINEIIDSIGNAEFDVIYVSQKKENFIDQQMGVALCNALYNRYNKDIFVITRVALSDDTLKDLKILAMEMEKSGNMFYLAVSIPGLSSYGVTETKDIIEPPEKRIDCLKRAKAIGINTILMARPLYPDTIIPVQEILDLIDKCKEYVSCVVASGIAVNDEILKQLGMKSEDFNYLADNEYLVGAIPCQLDYIDVRKEMKVISNYCKSIALPYFDHSISALNYIKQNVE